MDLRPRLLFFPSGEVNRKGLEKLLFLAHLEDAEDDTDIPYSHEQRVENFDPEHPDWKMTHDEMPLRELKELYKSVFGREYDFDDRGSIYSEPGYYHGH